MERVRLVTCNQLPIVKLSLVDGRQFPDFVKKIKTGADPGTQLRTN